MYTIYYNFKTDAHSIVNDAIAIPLTEDDSVVEKGSLHYCKHYLDTLGIMYQTIDNIIPLSVYTEENSAIPTEDEGIE